MPFPSRFLPINAKHNLKRAKMSFDMISGIPYTIVMGCPFLARSSLMRIGRIEVLFLDPVLIDGHPICVTELTGST